MIKVDIKACIRYDIGDRYQYALVGVRLMEKKYSYEDLIDIMAKLRGEGGCSWDREQTHESLIPHFLEETYEVIDAVKNQDVSGIQEELGDVLLQVVFHSQIAKEAEQFTMEDVIHGIATKLVYRHPHIFGEVVADTPEKVSKNWEKLKKKEKNMSTQTQVLESVPKVLPALMRAYKVQKKAGDVGFDWDDYKPAKEKIYEELEELEQEISQNNHERLEEELGDVLFSVVNLGRLVKVNPEFALTKSVEKFINRFRYIEKTALEKGLQLEKMTLEEMNQLWEDAKQM